MWIIDRLALRVGGEKDEDEADTVGCCSLRVEHIAFPSDNEIELDFLGKDSMRYFQRIDLTRWEAHGKVRGVNPFYMLGSAREGTGGESE